ncbi:MAG: aspartate-semialdehyde dehydrogenase [Bacteroidales bacterium]
MKIAVIGVTGLVGRTVLKVLQESNVFSHIELIPVASPASTGREIAFGGDVYHVVSMGDALEANPHFAIFSAGSSISQEWAPRFAGENIVVIDNSSAWRMDPGVPLVVPEVNGHAITRKHRLVANPNCSTIQMVMALAPLHRKYTIRRVVVSTYQSVTGTGYKAVRQLENERKGERGDRVYPHPIDLNLLPHAGDFDDNGYTSEEIKLLQETQKILNDNTIRITATAVRVPVLGGHSESVNIAFENDFNLTDVRDILAQSKGILVEDDFHAMRYPMPVNARDRDEVFVGRIRRDFSNANSLNMWIVSDNLRKGAATNAVQIAEHYVINKMM